MRLFTPDKIELIDVSAVQAHPEGLMIEGKIMGAMPMKAILRPAELRRGFRLLNLKVASKALAMLFQG
jgi:hypothetical protein